MTPGTNGRMILFALQTHEKHMYAGTVPHAVVRKRRAKNKLARAARRLHRLASK